MTSLCRKYEKIITDYRSGVYGDKCLTEAEIFRRAGEPDLFEQLGEDELLYLRDNGFMPRALCCYAIKALKERQGAKTKAVPIHPHDDTVATKAKYAQ